eukprot:jgi/Picsp_1/2959/NSC_01183-R1_hypothetical protein CHLNCDRAFT_136917 [Chlorella variabilis]
MLHDKDEPTEETWVGVDTHDEKAYLYEKMCENLCDLKIGWKPDCVASDFGAIGKVHDLPGKTWFRKYRANETSKYATESEWKKLRRPWRHYMAFFLLWGPPGNLFYNIRVPMTFVSIITIANAIYGTLIETVNPNLPHWFALGSSSTAFSMTSFLVSLLVGFKINRSFDRWWLAKQNFINICCRASGLLTSVSLAKLREVDQKDKMHHIQRLLMILPYALIMALYSLDRCPVQVRHILDEDDIHWMENTKDAWYFILCKIQVAFIGLNTGEVAGMLRELNQLRVESNALLVVKRTTFPYFLSKIPTALLMVYSFAVPMKLFGDIMDYVSETEELQGKTVRNVLHYWYLASLILVFSALILAANEAADLLEDPYYYIPMHDIARTELIKTSKLILLVDPDYGATLSAHDHDYDDNDKNEAESIKITRSWFFKI